MELVHDGLGWETCVLSYCPTIRENLSDWSAEYSRDLCGDEEACSTIQSALNVWLHPATEQIGQVVVENPRLQPRLSGCRRPYDSVGGPSGGTNLKRQVSGQYFS